MTDILPEPPIRSNGWWDFVTLAFSHFFMSPIIIEVVKFHIFSFPARILSMADDPKVRFDGYDLISSNLWFHLYLTVLVHLPFDLTIQNSLIP
jgi:hypothetical protein